MADEKEKIALLQAAAIIYTGLSLHSDRAMRIAMAVDVAEQLLAEIERRQEQ